MKTRLLFIGLSFITYIMTSCVVYYPHTIDIPLITEKNDLRLDGGVSVPFPSAHTTFSYGLTNKIAVQAFGSVSPQKIYYFQGAAGYYKHLNNQFSLELYSGLGYGYGNGHTSVERSGRLFGNYQLYFLQINYGKNKSRFANMDYGFGLKAGLLHTKLTDSNYYQDYNTTDTYLTYIDNSLLIEPSTFLRIGCERLKFNVKLGGCYMKKFTNKDKWIPYSFINLGVGINYIF